MQNPISKVMLPTFYFPHICELTMYYFTVSNLQQFKFHPLRHQLHVSMLIDINAIKTFTVHLLLLIVIRLIYWPICNNKLGNDNNEMIFLLSFVTETVVNVLIRFTSIEWNDKLSDKKSEEFDSTSKKITQAVKSYVIRSRANVCFCERD